MASQSNTTLALRQKETQNTTMFFVGEEISNSSGSRSQSSTSHSEEDVSSSSRNSLTNQQSHYLNPQGEEYGTIEAEKHGKVRKLINELPVLETLVSFAQVLENEHSSYGDYLAFKKDQHVQFQALLETCKKVRTWKKFGFYGSESSILLSVCCLHWSYTISSPWTTSRFLLLGSSKTSCQHFEDLVLIFSEKAPLFLKFL